MTVSNLLVLNLNHIGDILFTTPAIRALRMRFPEAHISVVVMQGLEDLLKHNPNLNEVITRQKGNLDIIRLLPVIRSRKYDASVLFTFSSVALALMCRLSGAPVRIGFDEPEIRRFLTDAVPRQQARHRVELYLDITRRLGADITDPGMEIFLGEEERGFAEKLLESAGVTGSRPIVVLNPGASVPGNRWSARRFGELGDRIKSEGLDVIVAGSHRDRLIIDEVLRSAQMPLIDISGRTTIGQLAAVLERCNVIVSNDTGPMHLSVSVGTPAVAIFGPADPRVTGPFDTRSVVIWGKLDCAPCKKHKSCGHRQCLEMITVDQAWEAVKSIISSGRANK